MKLREYQKKIAEKCLKRNTLVVLPTGLGKTIIAIAVARERLKLGKILMLAPTKPLCEQHRKTFLEWGISGVVVTGEINKEKRRKLWKINKVFFATPQTVLNDIREDRINLGEFSLLIFDEAHRAVGRYAYVEIAKEYVKRAKNPRIIGLTASPGDSKEKILEICKNLFIEDIEFRTEKSYDVLPYVFEKRVIPIEVELPENLKKASKILREILKSKIEAIKEYGIKCEKMSDLMNVKVIDPEIQIMVAQAIKLYHMIKIIESYGKEEFLEFVEKLKNEGKKSNILLIEKIRDVIEIVKKESKNPKIEKLLEILEKEKKKAIVFVNFVKTAERIEKILRERGIKAKIFAGKKVMKQKDQIRIIEEFKNGKYDVLISTSIGEEGLHIPAVDVVIFFEPVPSALRSIQRKGRTGRVRPGKVYIIYTKGSIDAGYYFVSKRKERRMIKNLIEVREMLKRRSLKEFFGGKNG